jgi:hypothetical protein
MLPRLTLRFWSGSRSIGSPVSSQEEWTVIRVNTAQVDLAELERRIGSLRD